MIRQTMSQSLLALTLTLICWAAGAQEIDWNKVQDEAIGTLQEYIQINTSNPPGDTLEAADFLTRILEREGLPVTRYESAPGKVMIYTRLKGAGQGKPILLLHHMDVVPADASRWKVDPFSGALIEGDVWGRGAMDMKGQGVAQMFAFLSLKRQGVPLARDIILMAVPDEEVGGALGARWMIKNHYDELDPEYVIDEGGFGSREQFAEGKLVYGISVAEKKVVWLKVRAEGVAGHGSQPHPQNPNDHLVRALARLLAEPLPTAQLPVLETMTGRIGELARNKFTNAIQYSTISLTSLRSGVGDPPKINIIPSIAEATLDCRVLAGTTTDAWLQEIRRRLGDPKLTLEVVYESDEPVVTPHETPLFRALEAAIRRHDPEAIVSPIMLPYGTDSNAFRPRGVKSYGIFPAVLSAEIVASMHSDSERLPVGELSKAMRILYDALRETAETR
jgi:acetylornithine deacetylase/succinyl-diaminopimelate desuccinylase-like protein